MAAVGFGAAVLGCGPDITKSPPSPSVSVSLLFMVPLSSSALPLPLPASPRSP
jgi:hypothetical protein